MVNSDGGSSYAIYELMKNATNVSTTNGTSSLTIDLPKGTLINFNASSYITLTKPDVFYVKDMETDIIGYVAFDEGTEIDCDAHIPEPGYPDPCDPYGS